MRTIGSAFACVSGASAQRLQHQACLVQVGCVSQTFARLCTQATQISLAIVSKRGWTRSRSSCSRIAEGSKRNSVAPSLHGFGRQRHCYSS
jgi:hypothetical protein